MRHGALLLFGFVTAIAALPAQAQSALTITTTALPNGTIEIVYLATVSVQGGTPPYTWSLTGALPYGLALDTGNGQITGVPLGPEGTSTFTIHVTDSSSPAQSASAQLSLTIVPQPLTIGTTSAPNGVVGSAYSAQFVAYGGQNPLYWSFSGLPPGLTGNSAGQVTGTPTTAGTYTFTGTVHDSGNPPLTASANFTITISGGTAPPPLSIVTSTVPNGVVNTAYSSTLSAQGGITPYAWSISSGGLPPGLALNSTTGAITGTPTSAGTYTFTAAVQDSSNPPQTASNTFSITISAAVPSLSIATSTVPSGIVNRAYSSTLSAQGGTTPYTWSISSGSLAPGLALNTATGAITGTPTTAGTYAFTAKLQDSSKPQQTATKALSLTISATAPALSLVASAAPVGVVNSAYSLTFSAQGGKTPYAWSISSGSLPSGLSLNKSTGSVTGTPTTSGVYTFTLAVQDNSKPTQSVRQAMNITVNPVASISLPTGNQQPGSTVSTGNIQTTQPAQSDISGTVSLSFTGNASGLPSPYANPGVCFSSSSCDSSSPTNVSFTIPAGSSSASIPALQTGTVAGTITLTLNVTGQPTTTSNVTVPQIAPIIEANSVQILDVSATGFVVELVANSTPRDMQSVTFTFAAAAGAQLSGTINFAVDVSSALSSWYTSAEGQSYGSAFSLQVPFTLSGDASAIGSVTATLTNSVGTSAPVSGTQ